jgi:hypothetical protein
MVADFVHPEGDGHRRFLHVDGRSAPGVLVRDLPLDLRLDLRLYPRRDPVLDLDPVLVRGRALR